LKYLNSIIDQLDKQDHWSRGRVYENTLLKEETVFS